MFPFVYFNDLIFICYLLILMLSQRIYIHKEISPLTCCDICPMEDFYYQLNPSCSHSGFRGTTLYYEQQVEQKLLRSCFMLGTYNINAIKGTI